MAQATHPVYDLSDVDNDGDGPCLVFTGSLHVGEGFRFWGPFEDYRQAEEFIKDVVSPDVSADWAFLEPPPILEVEITNNKKIIDKGIVLEFPASEAILNEKGVLIGHQSRIPGS